MHNFLLRVYYDFDLLIFLCELYRRLNNRCNFFEKNKYLHLKQDYKVINCIKLFEYANIENRRTESGHCMEK